MTTKRTYKFIALGDLVENDKREISTGGLRRCHEGGWSYLLSYLINQYSYQLAIRDQSRLACDHRAAKKAQPELLGTNNFFLKKSRGTKYNETFALLLRPLFLRHMCQPRIVYVQRASDKVRHTVCEA
jgi:hypothetical protein